MVSRGDEMSKEFPAFDKEDQTILASKLGELMKLCVESSSKHFTCLLEYAGHVNMWSIRVCKDGYDNNSNNEIEQSLYVNPPHTSLEGALTEVDRVIVSIKELKRLSDEHWSEESQEEYLQEIKLKKIEDTRKLLKELEEAL